MQQYKLWDIWKDVVGEAVSTNSEPSRFMGNILVIRVRHATWMQELSFMKPALIKKIKEAIPNITLSDIRFETGEITKKDDIPSQFQDKILAPLSADENEFIEQAAKEMKDEETRKQIRQVMTLYFQHKKAVRRTEYGVRSTTPQK